MTLAQIKDRLKATVIIEADFDIQNFYAGDFLSRVMGKAPSESGWLTIMSNVNVAGVAVLAEIKLIILCESVRPDELLKQKCASENIALITTEYDVFNACRLL